MEPINLTATVTASTGDTPFGAAPGLDISGIFASIFGGETGASLASGNGIFHFLNIIWSIYALLAFAVSIFMLVLYAYASSRRWAYYAQADKELRDAEDMYDEIYRGIKKSSRLDDVLKHIESENPNDWKLAIIEADIMLDDLLKQRGFAGASLGERLKSISPTQIGSLSEAWEAHKVRNRIAHDGADFVLTKRMAEDTIARYRRVFNDLGA
jgi:preprotein translocase subunit SecG